MVIINVYISFIIINCIIILYNELDSKKNVKANLNNLQAAYILKRKPIKTDSDLVMYETNINAACNVLLGYLKVIFRVNVIQKRSSKQYCILGRCPP